VRDTFVLARLDSRLFDGASTPLLNWVRFPNHVWQRVIRLMSPSGGKGKRKGRVSYQLLSINQLGAVYEALLSYRGFFAEDDLCKVMPERKQTRASDDEDAAEAESGGSTDMLDNAWFIPASRIGDYKNTEKVYDVDDAGHRKLRKYERGTFIYRPAGRDRQKSASYYTPQVLTRCLVKYALKELLQGKTADDFLRMTVCEPAMGSAAFLNEAIKQLAEKYLELKQAELGQRIPHEDYARELAKRDAIWPVFEEYHAQLASHRLKEADDAYRNAAQLIVKDSHYPYSAIVVDETQDFGPQALRHSGP
jgi:hypothetical protein